MIIGDGDNNTMNTKLVASGTICCYSKQCFPICSVDETLLGFLGYPSEKDFLSACDGLYSNAVHPDDRALLISILPIQLEHNNEFVLEYRLQKITKDYIWIYCIGKRYIDEYGNQMLSASCYDMTSKYKLKKSLTSLPHTLHQGFIATNNDADRKIIDFNKELASMLGYTTDEMKNFIGKELKELLIPSHHSSASNTMYTYDDLKSDFIKGSMLKKHGQELKVLINMTTGIDKYYYHITSLEESNHADAVIYDTYLPRSIETQKELEHRYQKILTFDYLAHDKRVVTAFLFNVETGILEKQAKNYGILFGDSFPEDYMALIGMVEHYILSEYKDKFYSTFDIEHVRKLCYEGVTEHFIEYERKTTDDTIGYFRGTLNFIENPYTGDVMCILTVRDITDIKTIERIVNKIVESESDFVTIIDIENNRIKVSINSRSGYLVPRLEENYDTTLEIAMREMIVPEEVEDSIQSMKLANLVSEIEKNGTYTCAFSIWNKETKKAERKLWKFSYFDESKKEIIYSRSDITQVYEKEQKQAEALTSALLIAQQANDAKTNFLSSMSHEIRTPMNAIIGMTNIATQSIGNNDQIEECLSKINISAKFLLSLINDILDMSRIESGKMSLKNEKMNIEDFIKGITYICHSQAIAKNIEFECIVDPFIDKYYIGDSMKLQQVLINILSNGIKFTDEYGKVTFSVLVKEKSAEHSMIRFIVQDTGMGMSEEFLDKVYEPFIQENMSITSTYGGTGLGLAISKSIIDMMDGEIAVQSYKGIGSTFTIDVKLVLCEDSQDRHIINDYEALQGLTALVVDDNQASCENTALILNEIGIKTDCTARGKKAIQHVQSLYETGNYFDIILINWKMPETDGIETIHGIRNIIGDKHSTIIVTTFDKMSIEHDVKEAGANLLMLKPMFISSFISVYLRTSSKKEKIRIESNIDYNFSGMRVLLVEDHPLNIEIADNILADKGFMVETAENGLCAVEYFTEKESGYFDAILMDIRMPVMDGLQATIKIRQSNHPDAKSIPIIAMTANAFDEDIEKSKAAGMNAHLAKPIEPQKLYQTLYQYLTH